MKRRVQTKQGGGSLKPRRDPNGRIKVLEIERAAEGPELMDSGLVVDEASCYVGRVGIVRIVLSVRRRAHRLLRCIGALKMVAPHYVLFPK